MAKALAAKTLAKRFTGTTGAKLLRSALALQPIFETNRLAVVEIAKAGTVIPFKVGKTVIKQDDAESDIFFIVVGSVRVFRNNRQVAIRSTNNHIGELTTIDTSVRRSATVIANEESVLVKVSEKDFTRIAEKFPFLWRHIAKEIGERLRQHVFKVQSQNAKIRVFIGSTVKSVNLANDLKRRFAKNLYEVNVWTNGIFEPGHSFIEALETEITKADFAALFLGPDDVLHSKRKRFKVPRDNLIFELGLFMGAIGRKRALMICPKSVKVKLPTDLDGVTSIRYADKDMKYVAKELRKSFKKLGTK